MSSNSEIAYNEVDGVVWLKTCDHKPSTKRASSSQHRRMMMDPTDGDRVLANEDTEEETDDVEQSDQIILNDDDVWDDTLLIQMYEESQMAINDALHRSLGKGGSSVKMTDKKATASTSGAMGQSKDKAKSVKANNKNNNNKKPKPKSEYKVVQRVWKEGDFCRLSYLEDNIEYEAKVVSINAADQSCLVRYIGYENEELRKLADLRPSLGDYFRQMQIKMAIHDGYGVQIVTVASDDATAESDSPKASTSVSSPSVPSNAVNTSRSANSEVQNGPRVIPPPPPPAALFANKSSADGEDDALASMLMSWYMTGYHTGYYQAEKEFKKKCTCHCGQ